MTAVRITEKWLHAKVVNFHIIFTNRHVAPRDNDRFSCAAAESFRNWQPVRNNSFAFAFGLRRLQVSLLEILCFVLTNPGPTRKHLYVYFFLLISACCGIRSCEGNQMSKTYWHFHELHRIGSKFERLEQTRGLLELEAQRYCLPYACTLIRFVWKL